MKGCENWLYPPKPSWTPKCNDEFCILIKIYYNLTLCSDAPLLSITNLSTISAARVITQTKRFMNWSCINLFEASRHPSPRRSLATSDNKFSPAPKQSKSRNGLKRISYHIRHRSLNYPACISSEDEEDLADVEVTCHQMISIHLLSTCTDRGQFNAC